MKKPYKVSFDICTYCNHKCTFCSNSDSRTIKSSVKLDKFIFVMENITKYIEIEKLSLSAKGEVLLNNDLEKIIIQSKEIFNIPYVYFSTNGVLLDQKRIKSICITGIDSIKLSINATNKTEYENIHQKDDFNTVIENVKSLLIYKKENKLKLKIFISIVTSQNKKDIISQFSMLLGDLFYILDDIFIYKLQYTPKENLDINQEIDAKNCLISPFKEIYINSDCTLGFCCKDYFDEINFGSLIENDFLELYNGEECMKMRKQFIDNEFEEGSLCYNCLAFEGLKK